MREPLPLRDRPVWLNILLAFCVYVAFIYSPWDYFSKPVSEAEDVWFGYLFRGQVAKFTEVIHFVVYAIFAWGLWKMRPWMRFWGTVYIAQLAIAFVGWGLTDPRGHPVMALVSGLIFAWATWAYWRAAAILDPDGDGTAAA